MPIGEILLKRNEISEAQLEDALQHQKFFPGKTGTQLVDLGFVPLESLEEALSEQFQIPCAHDEELENIDPYCRHQFPIEALEHFQVLPFKRRKNFLMVAMVNPGDQQARAWLKETADCQVLVHSISEIKFSYFIFRHFRRDLKPRIRLLAFRHYKKKCQNRLLMAPEALSETKKLFFETDRRSLEELGIKPLCDGEELGTGEVMMTTPKPPAKPVEYEPEFADPSQI